MTYIPATYNTNFDMSSIFPVVDETTGPDVLSNPGKHVNNLDFLDQGFQNILNNIRIWDIITWTGQKWTTLCYQYQGTTSTWLINLAFNGLSHPMQLQAGMRIRIPRMSEINRAVAQMNSESNSSRVISIGPPNVLG